MHPCRLGRERRVRDGLSGMYSAPRLKFCEFFKKWPGYPKRSTRVIVGGATRGDNVQDERYVAKEHMEVRRDRVSFAHPLQEQR